MSTILHDQPALFWIRPSATIDCKGWVVRKMKISWKITLELIHTENILSHVLLIRNVTWRDVCVCSWEIYFGPSRNSRMEFFRQPFSYTTLQSCVRRGTNQFHSISRNATAWCISIRNTPTKGERKIIKQCQHQFTLAPNFRNDQLMNMEMVHVKTERGNVHTTEWNDNEIKKMKHTSTALSRTTCDTDSRSWAAMPGLWRPRVNLRSVMLSPSFAGVAVSADDGSVVFATASSRCAMLLRRFVRATTATVLAQIRCRSVPGAATVRSASNENDGCVL